MLIDTHCHLGDEKFDEDRAEVVSRARYDGIGHIVVVSDTLAATDRAIGIAREHTLSATAGVHPHNAASWSPEVSRKLEERLDDEVVVAIGETGLDYHYDFSPREQQRRAFADQLALAEQRGLPVVVHSRSADQDMASMIRESRAILVLHSFSSGREVLDAALDKDAYVSFSGMVTFRSWRDDEAVRLVPPERLLIETDSPYLAPTPFRGKRNEPAYVVRVARRVAEVRGEDFSVLSQLTTNNARRCFDLRAPER